MSSALIPSVLNRAEYLKFHSLVSADKGSMPVRAKVAILASFTADFWKPYLVVEGARQGIGLEVWLAPYGQIEQQAFDPGSLLYGEAPDAVLILARLEDLSPQLAWGFLTYDQEALKAETEAVIQRLSEVVQRIREQGGIRSSWPIWPLLPGVLPVLMRPCWRVPRQKFWPR